jgi:hypothetical protein
MQEFEEEGKGAASPPPRRNQSELFLVPQDSASTSPRSSFDRTDEEHPVARRAKDAEPAAPAVDRVEIERLHAMLRQQEQATLQAIETAADLQTKLASAEIEVVKIGQQYHGFSKQNGSNNARKAAEFASLQSRWHTAQRELETQRRERRIEAVRTAAKVSTLERELEARFVPAETGLGFDQREKGGKTRRGLFVVAGIAAVAGLSVGAWQMIAAQSRQLVVPPASAAEAIAETGTKLTSQTANVTGVFAGLPADSPAAFSMAVNRLDDALASIPGRTPEDILQQASKNQKVCRLQWNAGHPSILFDGEPSHSNSLSATIDQCADAVKRLH